jgi:hypothetical protein
MWLWTADLGVLEPHIERLISDASGRDFAIDGGLSIDLAEQTVIVADDVRLGDADWSERDSMLEVGHVELRFDLWSLFRNRIEISFVDIRDARAHLVRRDNGDANWELATRGASPAADEDAGDGGMQMKVDLINIEDFAITLDSPERPEPLEMQIDMLRKSNRDDDFVAAKLAGTIGDRAVTFDGSAGPRVALRAGKDVEFDIEGRLDTLTLSASGKLDDIVSPVRPSFEFAVVGPDIDDLGRVFQIGDLGEGGIDLRGTLRPEADGPLSLDVEGNFGQLDVEARGAFSDLANLRRAELRLLASGPNLSRILRLAGVHDIADSPFMLSLDAERDGDRLTIREADLAFGNARFNATAEFPRFPALDDGQLSLDIEGPDIAYFRSVVGLPGVATGAFGLNLDYTGIPDGDDGISLAVHTALGRLEANGTVDPGPGYVGSRVDVRFAGDDLGTVGSLAGLDGLPSVPLLVEGRLELEDGAVRLLGPVTAKADDITATVNGRLLVPDPAGSRMTVAIEGPDIAETIAMFADAGPIPALTYALDGDIEFASSSLRLHGLKGTVGSSAVAVDGRVNLRLGIVGSRLTLKAAGPAMEEITASFPGIGIAPGGYDLSGTIALGENELELADVELSRENGDLRLDMKLGLPPAERRAVFDVSARGRNIRSLVSGIGQFEIAELPFEVDAEGRLDSGRLSIEQLSGKLGELRAQARGSVLLGGSSGEAEFRVRGEAPDIAMLGTLGGVRFNPQRVSWQMDLKSGAGVVETEKIELVIGDSDIRGRIRYEAGPVPSLQIDLESDSLIVLPLLEKQEREYEAEPEFDDGRLIPDIVVPFDTLARVDAALDLDIGFFRRDAIELRDLNVRTSLRDGVLTILHAGARGPTGRFDIRGSIDPAAGEGRVGLEVLARDLTLQPNRDDADPRVRADIALRLDSTGNDLRTLAARADGHVYVHTRGGRMFRNRLLQTIYGDMLGEILGTINPFYRESKEDRLECIVVPLSVTDGQVSSPANVFARTDKLNIVVRPELNFATEAIDITFRTMPRKGLTISAAEVLNPYVKVVGTLASPELAVDEQGVLLSGGAAFATGGLTILARAAWNRLTRSSDPCRAAATAGIEKLGEPFPSFDTAVPADGGP